MEAFEASLCRLGALPLLPQFYMHIRSVTWHTACGDILMVGLEAILVLVLLLERELC